MSFTENTFFLNFFLFVCERCVLLQTGLYITSCNPKYFKRLIKLATYLFNQEKWLLDGGLKLALFNFSSTFKYFETNISI